MFKDLTDWKKKLREFSQSYAVLVEGKMDAKALRRFGVKNIVSLAGKRFSDIPDILEGNFEGAILLYDLDPHGERINRKIKTLLTSQGFKVLEDFREYLREAGIIHIEDLSEVGNGQG
ncbi:MAG: toprim domain-containing protein [Aquificae bacterium]|nr:toprim domain-containing protein [Aquificota bacterium]